MKHSFLIAVVILAFSTAAYGIKCYVCNEATGDASCSKSTLEDNKDKYLKDCGGSVLIKYDRCARIWGEDDDKTLIANTCANQLGCDTAKKACDEVKEGECKVGCCDSDACNAATPVSFSLFLMTVCSVLGLILLE